MANQTWVYTLQEQVFLAHRIKTGRFRLKSLPILTWVQHELTRAANTPDLSESQRIRYALIDSLCNAPGMYGVTTFEKPWGLEEDIDALRPFAPESFQERLNAIFGHPHGATFPPQLDTPLRVINLRGWTFFTRQEIQQLEPICREALRDQASDSLEYEWHDIFTAHTSQPYDWLILIHPFEYDE